MNITVCPYCQMKIAASSDGNCPSCGAGLPNHGQPNSNPFADNPFADAPQQTANPYQAPAGQAGYSSPAVHQLKIPAIVLIVMGALWTPYMFTVATMMTYASWQEPDFGRPGERAGRTVGHFVPPVVCLISLIGSVCMVLKRGLWVARIGAIVSCIPVCGPCFVLGIPFGIWALVLLFNRDVADSFH